MICEDCEREFIYPAYKKFSIMTMYRCIGPTGQEYWSNTRSNPAQMTFNSSRLLPVCPFCAYPIERPRGSVDFDSINTWMGKDNIKYEDVEEARRTYEE